MTEDQKVEALQLMSAMPFLGGNFAHMDGDHFSKGLLENLRNLHLALRLHADAHDELVKEVQEYRTIIRALKSVARLLTAEPVVIRMAE